MRTVEVMAHTPINGTGLLYEKAWVLNSKQMKKGDTYAKENITVKKQTFTSVF